MTQLSKIILSMAALVVICIGFLPKQSVLCVQGNGAVALELGLTGSCECTEESNLQEEHDHDHSASESCESQVDCPLPELDKSCNDSELQELISTTRQSLIIPIKKHQVLALDLTLELSFKLNPTPPTYRLTKPSLPPPHLEVLEKTQFLI